MDMEEISLENAIATAEGAISLAVSQCPINLHRCRCLILGYGRCGQALADRLGLAVAPVLARPRSRDQRALARRDRLANMEGRFIPLPGASAFPSVILVDDVYTTGATLFAATDAVRVAGAATVRCLTSARVW